MRALPAVIVALVLAGALANAEAPFYSAASIVNSADNQSGPLAPNTLATIYGQNLSYGTQALSPAEVQGGTLPTVFPGTGVHVLIGNIVANLIYVSPTQINFLVPANLILATVNLQVVVDGWAGPAIPIQLAAASPGLFQLDAQNAIATRADGSLVTPDTPAKPGDVVVLYATGLGQTRPPAVYSLIPKAAASITEMANFSVSFDGVAADPGLVFYAGIAPGFGGLYQINLTLPGWVGPNPQIVIGVADALSAPGVTLPVRP
jgi:uncharacterized protein (TIGR03437 family)